MLQRIQTLYIAIAFALTLLLLYVPMADFTIPALPSPEGEIPAKEYSYTAVGMKQFTLNADFEATANGYSAYSVALLILVVLVLLVNVGIVLLYKKRILQMRVCVADIVMNLGVYALFFLFVLKTSGEMSSALNVPVSLNYHFPLVFPVVNSIFILLAISAIGKDEALVRSLDRIR